MKKIGVSLLFIVLCLTIASCKKKEEIDIMQAKDFEIGDIVEYQGVIYEYFTDKYISSSLYSQDYIFKDEEKYKSYYDYYYYDMSDYKNQKEIKPLDLWDYYRKKGIDVDIEVSPTSAYYLRIFPLFIDSTSPIHEGFIVKGYNWTLPKNVVIPTTLFGHKVRQIGFKAFENAPMETFEIDNNLLIHPFAFHNCPNLERVSFPSAYILSMGISNCENLESIGTTVYPLGDCVLYDLPQITEIKRVDFISRNYFDFQYCFGQGGIRKSMFYKCPKLREIGSDQGHNKSTYEKYNVVYTVDDVPIYVYDLYNVILNEDIFRYEKRENISIVYNPDTLEAYLPFLDDGLDKKGTFIIPENSNIFVEEDDGIYAYVSYENEVYNAKVLVHKK